MPAKQRTPKVSRNPDLIRGVGKYSRSQMYHKRALWAIKAKNGGVFPRHDTKSKVDSSAEKPPKFYPAEDVKKPRALLGCHVNCFRVHSESTFFIPLFLYTQSLKIKE
ncbi:60S ribosomal protein L6E protein [Raphanus sativus]|nr:60S ribosomal protein L6E protein [Raphanus sativus]